MGNGVVLVRSKLRSRRPKPLPLSEPALGPIPTAFPAGRGSVLVEASDDGFIVETLDGYVKLGDPGVERIFGFRRDRPFAWAEGSTRRRLAGMRSGLAIGKRLVERRSGDIGVTSAAGAGFPFCFTLSLDEAPSSAAEQDEGRKPANGEPVDARILVVDDLDSNREIVEACLEGRGYRVDAVSSALDAIQLVGTETFDLVLMDIQMPVMDGVTATKRIRALPKPMSDVPILAMTGHVMPMQIKAFLDAGMNGHIAKPISRAKLHESVRRWGWRRNSAPSDLVSSACVDEDGAVDELVAIVGVERTQKIAKDFLSQLDAAFQPDCTVAQARRQAHGLINCAGILGLPRFVGACRTLDCHRAGDAASERAALADIRAERALARDTLATQLIPRLRTRVFRPVG